MRIRAQDADGDMTFGQGGANFLVNSPAAVAQLVQTRLLLFASEWFLDVTEGTPYGTQIVGSRTALTRDTAIKARILTTPGVVRIAGYSSSVVGRAFAIQATIDTIYGLATFATAFGPNASPVPIFPLPTPSVASGKVGQLDFSDPDQSGFLGAI